MSDEDIDKLLHDLFRSEYAPPLTDALVDAFLDTPVECSQESINRIRARFAEKVLMDIHKTPVTDIKEKLPFGRWIEAIRQKARLTREDVATAIKKDANYIEAIETGTLAPWNSGTSDIVRLIDLFRLHIRAFSELLSISFAVNQRKGAIGVSPRRSSKQGAKAENEIMSRVLDIRLANKSLPGELNNEIREFLNGVANELMQCQIKDLLD
jgi:transcriptional regulator with XRE-family HTH domain